MAWHDLAKVVNDAFSPWVPLAQVTAPVFAFATIYVAVRKFFSERANQQKQQDRESHWRRLDYLAEMSKALDEHPRAQPFMQFCDFDPGGDPAELRSALSQRTELSESLEYVLKLLSRMRMAIDIGAITVFDARMYTWYFTKILQVEEVRQFCIDRGYADIVHLAAKVVLDAARDAPTFEKLPTYDTVLEQAATASLPPKSPVPRSPKLAAPATKPN